MILLRAPQTATDWDAYYLTRYETLREPLGFPPGRYEDPTDATSVHLMAWDDAAQQPAGVVRGHMLEDTLGQIRYMGVRAAYARQGIGNLLLQAMEQQLVQTGATTIGLHARDYALPFYTQAGYHIVRESGILIADIPHYWMEKKVGTCSE